jgi:hypothetical protein
MACSVVKQAEPGAGKSVAGHHVNSYDAIAPSAGHNGLSNAVSPTESGDTPRNLLVTYAAVPSP